MHEQKQIRDTTVEDRIAAEEANPKGLEGSTQSVEAQVWWPHPLSDAIKRGFDVTLSLLALMAFAPLIAVIFGLLRLEGGPALVGLTYVGRGGRRFQCIRFRTTQFQARRGNYFEGLAAANSQWSQPYNVGGHPEITELGRFLRFTGLSHLPQFLNVLFGDMSFVGPRPVNDADLPRYGHAAREYLACRPGLTGLWDLPGSNPLDFSTRVRLDRIYSRRRSMLMDLKILFRFIEGSLGGDDER